MGQGQSAPTNSSQSVLASPTSSAGAFLESHYGFQILRVHSNSPVSECAVHPYFDYIIAVNSVEVVMFLFGLPFVLNQHFSAFSRQICPIW